jgi:hypothetical protein
VVVAVLPLVRSVRDRRAAQVPVQNREEESV